MWPAVPMIQYTGSIARNDVGRVVDRSEIAQEPAVLDASDDRRMRRSEPGGDALGGRVGALDREHFGRQLVDGQRAAADLRSVVFEPHVESLAERALQMR